MENLTPYSMKSILNLVFITALFFLSCKEKKTEAEQNTPETVSKTEWKSLFDGETLEGWTPKIRGHALNDNYNNTFKVENGHIKVSYENYDNFDEQYGHLFYNTPFSNYRLRLEYRFIGEQVEGGADWALKNSGIMIHSQSPESMLIDQNFPLSIEVQLLGGVNEDEPRPTCNLCTPATNVDIDGELYTTHCINSTSETYYDDQWVTAEVEVKGDSITHFINGKKVLDYSNPVIGGEFLDETSEEIQAKDGTSLTGGYISLQSESHPVEFRAIEIMEY